ncbi:MAG TPA: hypothetical protein VFB32_05660, partial [Rudaea sp.]|nr:hypothetical protein [Rudaea sp.]
GSLKARQLVVKRAAEYLDKLAQASTGETDLQRELAGANERLGEILGGGGVSNLGDLRGADARYGTALAMREALASNSQATPADVEALAQLHVSLSRFKALAGDLPRAEAHASRAVDLLESPLARQSTDPHRLGYLARAQHQRGYVRARRGNNETAVASHREATQNARRQVELLPDDDQEQARLARIEVDYAETLRYTGDDAQALAMIADARQRAERLLKADPHNQRLRMTLFQAFYNEGEVYEDQEHWSACLEAFRRAVALADELRTAQPDDVSSQLTAIHAYYALGMGFIHSGAIVRGIAVLDEAVAGAQHLLRTMPNNAYVLSQLSGIEVERGEALLGIHRTADGCRDIRSGMEVWARLDRTGSMPGDSARNRQHYAELLTRCPQS